MSDDHVRVREYVVREMRAGVPLTPDQIGRALTMSEPLVVQLLADLESHLLFLVRGDDGAVRWAFPVTAEPTPHQLRFRSGEILFGA